MNKINFYWLSILNIQLFIGFFASYGYFHRHLIIENVPIFMFCIFIFSNFLFLVIKKIKLQSLKIFFSITVSSFLFILIFMKKNNVTLDTISSNDALIIISTSLFYTILLLKLYIITPLLIFYELFIHNKSRLTIF